MAQEALDLQSILKTAAPLLTIAGGFTAFSFTQRLKLKEEKIQDLEDGKRELKDKLCNAEGLIQDLQATVVDLINNQEENLSPKVVGVLNSILGKLQIDKIEQREFEDCKCAAAWLQHQKKNLVRNTIKETVRLHSPLIPRNKRARFQKNIEGCLQWVYACLDFYGHPEVPLENYVNAPVLDSPLPYTYAIKYIKSFETIKGLDKRKNLTQQQSTYLKDMLDELLLKLPHLFS
jgi:hypothetical protein